jgi:hypothetical protein
MSANILELSWIKMNFVKTQMGTTFSSYSHFVDFELLHRRRQATVIMVGCIFIFVLLARFIDLFLNPLLSGFAFYSIAFRLSLRFSFRSTFPDGVFLQNTTWFFSCDRFFSCTEHCRLFSFRIPRNFMRNLRPGFFCSFNSTF